MDALAQPATPQGFMHVLSPIPEGSEESHKGSSNFTSPTAPGLSPAGVALVVRSLDRE